MIKGQEAGRCRTELGATVFHYPSRDRQPGPAATGRAGQAREKWRAGQCPEKARKLPHSRSLRQKEAGLVSCLAVGTFKSPAIPEGVLTGSQTGCAWALR